MDLKEYKDIQKNIKENQKKVEQFDKLEDIKNNINHSLKLIKSNSFSGLSVSCSQVADYDVNFKIDKGENLTAFMYDIFIDFLEKALSETIKKQNDI